MSKFQYRARDVSGAEASGVRDAEDKFELARILRAEGFLLLEATDNTAGSAPRGFNFEISPDFLKKFQRVSIAEKIVFSKNLSVMIGAGLPLTRALDAMSRESHNQRFKDTISDLVDQIRRGKPFAESLSQHPKIFSSLYTSMIEAGEKSGKLRESLTVLANQLQADYDLIRKVRGAMMYPAVILSAMILIGILMMIYVVPTLQKVFEDINAPLPLATQFIIGLSVFLSNHTLLFFVSIAAVVGGLLYFRKTVVGKRFFNTFFIKAPLIGPLARKFNAARTARTMSSLLSAGVHVMEALDITARVVQNYHYAEVLVEAKKSVQRGDTISKVILSHEKLYPSLVGEMLSVGEETGESSRMLNEVATFYEQQVADTTRDLSTIIEPILMIVIGAAVGFFAISMISPMYTLVDVIQ
ncbi:MAG: hypothetical protein A3F26_00655 [Candidatus Ryanbacteria bacterium RIFCSPHIGHO2_12_FULL_47_12b]|uniref:Type II secretion system protein GspF domain-containing protein n=2 Tax=Candidatus Ryaniibacteriota TaxID=1817914 RepID=A0A1G2H6L5_9BACT|nr:MAG: hypothetical protein A2844_00680 [Candidatus Ryanbacteria bacterium RIFCSPHIGHO2_01_FULL_48_80]OGZ51248.1 MAG: hypothetical protein A3F26_00655 [Candidatus Ryanbacteria bacterium RIFCSPHIGHO2_12_FULL_47_12b]OGZ53080.1 MAG: hypothetical protein A3A29_02295 [Candidatus Ryanbacteria bacterium RIFCSPLOWO2_01_FULL_47_79]OGZ55237.1 MAG: hypothetical protein A3J04_02205 [Candidatus Ryanbacteria bacterium RIFCSPLOWO2_02_FULL_47_14]OGZ57960.1 MAG: hypothetical protein A3G60_01250 [Candidatus Rya